MDFSDPAHRAVFFDVHSGLPREGPGDRPSMQRALAIVRPLPADARILDIACGPGGQTLDLADLAPAAQITAVDGYEPFLRDLERGARARGVADRIRILHGDMRQLPFADGEFDLIWCEGGAYIMGFSAALRAWKPLLKAGGALALSEPVWLVSERPERVNACWAEYPAMLDADGVRGRARAEGYDILGDFVLPDAAWQTHYYGPLQRRLNAVEARYAGDPVAQAVLDEIRLELDCRRDHGDTYGYLFLVLRPS